MYAQFKEDDATVAGAGEGIGFEIARRLELNFGNSFFLTFRAIFH